MTRRVEYAQITYGENPSMLWEVYVDGLPVGPELKTREDAIMVSAWLAEYLGMEDLDARATTEGF